MSSRFRHYLKIVAVMHLLIVVVLILGSGWKRFFRKKPPVRIPVEFMVDAPSVPEEITPELTPEPEPEAIREPLPEPEPVRRKKKPIQRSTKRVTRTPESRPEKKSALSEEEIRKLLERGVKTSHHATQPDEDALSLERIRLAFYNAWDQPSREETDGRAVVAEISFAVDGRITRRRIADKSGSAAMDESVMMALNAVTRVDGLTPDFHRRYPSVTIAFKVE